MNSTSFFYNHSSQWRYETVGTDELLSPLADKSRFGGSLIDFNVRRAHGLAAVGAAVRHQPAAAWRSRPAQHHSPVEFTVDSLKNGTLGFGRRAAGQSAELPRNLFVWRSNLLGSSGKGHGYMLKYLLGTENGVQGEDLGQQGGVMPQEVGMARAGAAKASWIWW